MAKKLKVEVETDTRQAKRELADLANGVDSGGASDQAASAAKRMAQGADAAAKSSRQLSQSASEGAASLKATVKVFGGMAVRMAASAAAQSLPEGSTARTTVDAAGGAIAGALQGAVAGPIGAVAGGLMGLTSALMQANAEEKARKDAILATNAANREQLEAMWKAEDRTEKFKKQLDELSKIEDPDLRRERLTSALKEREVNGMNESDTKLFNASSNFAGEGGDKAFREALTERSALKSEISQLKALLEQPEARKSGGGGSSRESMSALDNLSRLGASFGGDSGRDMLNVQKDQLEVLKSIDRKSTSGGATWQ